MSSKNAAVLEDHSLASQAPSSREQTLAEDCLTKSQSQSPILFSWPWETEALETSLKSLNQNNLGASQNLFWIKNSNQSFSNICQQTPFQEKEKNHYLLLHFRYFFSLFSKRGALQSFLQTVNLEGAPTSPAMKSIFNKSFLLLNLNKWPKYGHF